MNTKRKLPTAKTRHLNSYDTLHEIVSSKPAFNQEDWVSAANDGALDLYIDDLFKSDKIADYEAYKDKYNLDYADSKTRRFALHNEVAADTQNSDTKRKRTIVDNAGNEVEEEYFASDYEYNLQLIRQQNDYLQQLRQREIAQDIKNSMNAGEHILSGIVGAGTSFASGVLSGVDNLIALGGAAGELIVAQKGTKIDTFVESLASNKYRPFADDIQEIVNFESNYTSMRDIDGNYSNYGKYIGGVATSLGEMLPSMIIGKGVGKAFSSAGASAKVARTAGSIAAQSSFYAGMSAGNVQDTFLQYQQNGADIDSALILANSAIKSTLQWAVEYGLGKILGPTSLDNMVFGRAQTGITSKTLTKAGLLNILKDAGQEGLEEVLQDTSDFFVDEGFEYFIRGYKNYGDISWQSLMDAFIIGAISSVAGSARNIVTSKSVIDTDGKKLNKIASWQYGLDMNSLVESLNVIEESAAHFRTNEAQLLKRNLSDKERNNIKLATIEAYASYRMITSIYEEIGEERFKAANNVLEKMTTQIKSGVFTSKDAIDYVDSIKDQLKALSESAIKKIVNEIRDGAVTETKEIVNKNVKEPKSPTSDKAKTIIDSLEVDDVVITDGDIVYLLDKTFVVSKNRLDNSSVQELLKHTAVKKLSQKLIDVFGEFKIYNDIKDKYEKYSGIKADDETFACAILFDKSFFTSTLLDGNKDVYKLLSYFVQLSKDVKVGRAYDAIYKNLIDETVKHWCLALSDYCAIHVEAQPDMFLFAVKDKNLRKDLEMKIKRYRMANIIYQNVLNSTKDLNKLEKNEQAWLKNKCDILFDKDMSENIWSMLNSENLADRNKAMRSIQENSNLLFNNGYDGKNRLPDVSVANRVFNNFLDTLGLMVSNFYNTSTLNESDRKYIIDVYGSLNDANVLTFRKEQFKKYTNEQYGFNLTVKNSQVNISIESNEKYVGGTLLTDNIENHYTDDYDKSTGIIKVSERGFIENDMVSDEFKHLYKYMTLNDFIDNPDVLSDEYKNKIIDFIYKKHGIRMTSVSPQSIILYFNYILGENSMRSLAMDSNGKYVIVNLDLVKNMLINNVNITEKSTIQDIVKNEFIPEGLELSFVSDEEWKNIVSDNSSVLGIFRKYRYDPSIKSNVIDNKIYVPKSLLSDQKQLKTVILHELQHAIQFSNNLNGGVGDWFYSISTSDQKSVIRDFKKYMPHLLEGLKTDKEISEKLNTFGYHSSGEFYAFGVAGNVDVIDFLQIYAVTEGNRNYVVLPWGKRYKIIKSNVKKSTKPSNDSENYLIGVYEHAFDVKTSKVRNPHKNELREDDKRAKNFVSSERKPNVKYVERYYVLNDDGTQKLHKDGTPVYHRVYGNESRYVSKRKHKGTNLEHFTKKYKVTQLSKEFQKFVLNAKGLDPILQNKISGDEKGTLTERDVMDYLRSAENIDDKTFKAINDSFFKNDNFETFDDLKTFMLKLPSMWSYARLIREVPAMKKYSQLLTSSFFDIDMLIEALNKNSDLQVSKSFENNLSRWDTFMNRSLEIFDEYTRISSLKWFDGTLESAWKIGANVRYPALHNYEITHKTQLPKDVITDAYKDMLDTIEQDKKSIVDLIKKGFMAKLYQEAKDDGVIDDATVANIFYQANELEEKLIGMSVSEIRRTYGKNYDLSSVLVEGRIAEISDEKVNVSEEISVSTSSSIVNSIRGYLRTIRLNLTDKEKIDFVKNHSDLFDKNLKLRKEVYQNAIPNKNSDGFHYRNKDANELQNLLEKISELKDSVLNEKRLNKESVRINQKRDKMYNREIKRLERENERLRKSLKEGKSSKVPSVTEFLVENEVIKLNTNIEIPDVLKSMLQTQYEKTAKTTVKNLSEDSERHVKLESKSFYEKNAEKLNSLTQGDVNRLIDFYLRANVSFNDVNAPYIATETWILTYLIKAGRNGSANFVIDSDTLSKLESTLKTLQSMFGTGQVTWREALKQLNPEVIIAQQMSKRAGLEISESEIESLLSAVKSKDMQKVESEKNKIYKNLLVQAKRKNADRKTLDKVLDKILQYERLAMLSGPGTWVRNWTSNQIIEGSNKLTDGMNGKFEKFLFKLFPESQKVKNQYTIAGTKVDSEVSEYIKMNLLDNGLLDMVIESLTKYDVRKNRSAEKSEDVLTQLIANSVVSMFNSEHLSDNKIVTKMEDFIRERISDNKSVKKAAISYLGKIITEDLNSGRIKSKVEVLSKNTISTEFLSYVAEAYKLASYDYMHKSNFLTELESKLARKSNGAYFIYKQLFPFAGASWNWFVEGLNYTPIGLAKSIVNFAKLEKTAEKMEESRRTFKNNDVGISGDFAKYMTIRNIGKGVLGSAGFIIGALLAGFGLARIDEEDDKYKLVVANNVYIDISDLFSTQGVFLGMSIFGSIRNKESAGDVFIAALDQLFLDSTFADVFNNFRYSKSFGDWLVYQPYSMLNMMIPNFIKTITSISTPYKIKYSDGIKGKAERLLVNSIPGISYAFPHYYDPYTGEKQIPYKMWALTKSLDKLTPFGLSVYNISDLEKLCIEFGINKGQLTGRYTINDEEIKLNSSQVEKLNQFYGQLNTSRFKELKSGKMTYKIQEASGKYKKVTWNSATDKEKAAIVSRIMTNNSGYAKIYALTNSGKYKYYASDSEYKELKKLGVIKNVYKSSGKNNGFVKVN